jgi:hypothetical protein
MAAITERPARADVSIANAISAHASAASRYGRREIRDDKDGCDKAMPKR